jgi:Coenzyme PQQ synthesis protein D (PqqD)
MTQRIRIAPGVHARRFGQELVILDTAGAQYFGLNDVGAEMWERLVRGDDDAEIVREVAARYDVDAARVASDLAALVTRLLDAGLARREGAT